eukprot:6481880-Amphidinium_carterae.2
MEHSCPSSAAGAESIYEKARFGCANVKASTLQLFIEMVQQLFKILRVGEVNSIINVGNKNGGSNASQLSMGSVSEAQMGLCDNMVIHERVSLHKSLLGGEGR